MELLDIVLNDDFETTLHYLVSEIDSNTESCFSIGIIKADYKQNCHAKLLECILAYTKAEAIIDFELCESDGMSFHIFDVTMVVDGEEEIRTYNVDLIPIY